MEPRLLNKRQVVEAFGYDPRIEDDDVDEIFQYIVKHGLKTLKFWGSTRVSSYDLSAALNAFIEHMETERNEAKGVTVR